MLILVQYLFRARDIQSNDTPSGVTKLATSHVDDNHGVDNVFMISPGDEVAATDSFIMGNRDGRPGSDVTNIYESIDAPHEQPDSLDGPQPTGPLYSEEMKRNMSRVNNISASCGLYEHIQSIDESTIATAGEPSIATETPSKVVYSQVNKPKKRASPHSALTGNESRYQSMDWEYEQICSNAVETGEIDLFENDLYETSEVATNRK